MFPLSEVVLMIPRCVALSTDGILLGSKAKIKLLCSCLHCLRVMLRTTLFCCLWVFVLDLVLHWLMGCRLRQRGFTAGSSPMNSALPIEESYRESEDNNASLHLVLLDAKAAFDTVIHSHMFRRVFLAGTILPITGNTVIHL
jgi:hypothetical protein